MISSTYSQAPPPQAVDAYAFGNCTYWVAAQRYVPNNLGDANQWFYNAGLDGLSTGHTPRVGSVAQTYGDSWLGHVAYVEAVYQDGTFEVSEMNYNGYDIVDNRVTSTAEFPNFIY